MVSFAPDPAPHADDAGGGRTSYDVIIIGGGPVACELARLTTLLGYSAAIVEKSRGGAALAAPTGWVSKAFYCASKELGSGGGHRVDWARIERDHVEPCGHRAARLTRMKIAKFRNHLAKTNPDARLDFVEGEASFVGRERVQVDHGGGNKTVLSGHSVFIATGSMGARLPSLPWDDPGIEGWMYNSETINGIGRLPEHIVIQGGGIIGVEYAFIFRRLGARVTVVLNGTAVLNSKGVDGDIRRAVQNRLEGLGVEIIFEDGSFDEVRPPKVKGGNGTLVLANSGRTLECDAFASMVGRQGTAEALNLPAAGLLPATKRGHAQVVPSTMRVRTAARRRSYVDAPRVWAAGDVAVGSAIGPQGLVSTGIAQANLAVQSAFSDDWAEFLARAANKEGGVGRSHGFDTNPPMAIWIEDGIGMAGISEEQAAERFPDGDWASMKVHYNDTIKACVEPRPDDEILKLIFQRSTGRVLGVFIFGIGSPEMIHHAGGIINNPVDNTVWHVVKSIPPAVTYAEVLMIACQRAIDIVEGVMASSHEACELRRKTHVQAFTLPSHDSDSE